MIAQMAARLNAQRSLVDTLDVVLADVITLLGAHFGDLRLLDDDSRLSIVAQSGLTRRFLVSMRRLTADGKSAWTQAAAAGKVVAIENVTDDTAFTAYVDLADEVGFQASVSAPLTTHRNMCVGVVSAYFKNRHRPHAVEINMLTTYSKIAADRILAHIGPEPLSVQAEPLFERFTETQRRAPPKNQQMPHALTL